LFKKEKAEETEASTTVPPPAFSFGGATEKNSQARELSPMPVFSFGGKGGSPQPAVTKTGSAELAPPNTFSFGTGKKEGSPAPPTAFAFGVSKATMMKPTGAPTFSFGTTTPAVQSPPAPIAPPSAGEGADVWRCTVCGKIKDLPGDHLKNKIEIRTDCWPCATKRLFKKEKEGSGSAPKTLLRLLPQQFPLPRLLLFHLGKGKRLLQNLPPLNLVRI
jgi:hypothetical protein